MQKSNHVLFSFTWPGEPPTEEELAAKFGFPKDAIDPEFGIVEIDDIDHIYCIMIPSDDIPNSDQGGQAFSNPRIEPFDLQEE